MTIGMRIQENRKHCGFSQEQLAERLGVSRQAVSKWELDTAVPDTDKVVALAGIFKISTDALLVGESEEPKETERAVCFRQGDSLGWLLRLVKTKGYRAGYVLMGWGGFVLLMAAVVSYFSYRQFRTMLAYMDGQSPPGVAYIQLLVPALLVLLGLAAVIVGIVIVVKYKLKSRPPV